MYLTLEVVSPQAASLGADRRRIVGPGGLTIGRMPGNDWIIPDPYISKQHARITFANGAYFVESLGRNAIAIGAASNPLPGNQPQPLRNGDHLFIDQYEIIVTATPGDPPGTLWANDDPFGVLPANPAGGSVASGSGRLAPSSPIPDMWDGGLVGAYADTGVLDPLAALGGDSNAAQPESLPPVNWQQASALEDHFEPPPVRATADGSPFDLLEPQSASSSAAAVSSSAAAEGIPDNWDRTNLTPRQSAPAVRSPAPPVSPSRVGRPPTRETPISRRVIPEPRLAAPQSRAPSEPMPRTPVSYAPPLEPLTRAPDARPLTPDHEGAPIDSGGSRQLGRASPAPGRADPQAWTTSCAAGSDFTELMRGAGLSDQSLSPEMLHELGQVLRVVVEGVMDVLRARTEIKSQFRLPLTRIQSVENNPLKHSPNVESALHTLLVQRNPGFLSTVQAFEDAFADIRNHQMAMLEGLRTAFESMLQSFDPEELEKEFERGTKRGLSFGGAKSKFWDLYVDRFAHLGGDADDTFRRLFGDVFAAAYEKQLERLKTLGRNTGKT